MKGTKVLDGDGSGELRLSVLSELPGYPGAEVYYYPDANRGGGRDGLIVQVMPSTAPSWVGVFAFGDVSVQTPSEAWVLTGTSRICVVARGAGYVVDAEEPTTWEEIPANPIRQVMRVPARGLVVFATFTDVIAYGAGGMRWRTARLASDDLEMAEVTDTVIKGLAWDASIERWVAFSIDLETGAHQGGAWVPDWSDGEDA